MGLRVASGWAALACLAGRAFLSSHGCISALWHLRVGDFACAWERRVGQGPSVDRVRSAPQAIRNAVSSLECGRMATSITRGGFSTGRLCGILTPRNRRVPPPRRQVQSANDLCSHRPVLDLRLHDCARSGERLASGHEPVRPVGRVLDVGWLRHRVPRHAPGAPAARRHQGTVPAVMGAMCIDAGPTFVASWKEVRDSASFRSLHSVDI